MDTQTSSRDRVWESRALLLCVHFKATTSIRPPPKHRTFSFKES